MISLCVNALLRTLQHTVIHAMQLSGVNSPNFSLNVFLQVFQSFWIICTHFSLQIAPQIKVASGCIRRSRRPQTFSDSSFFCEYVVNSRQWLARSVTIPSIMLEDGVLAFMVRHLCVEFLKDSNIHTTVHCCFKKYGTYNPRCRYRTPDSDIFCREGVVDESYWSRLWDGQPDTVTTKRGRSSRHLFIYTLVVGG